MGSRKGDRNSNHGNKKKSRRRQEIPDSFDDGGGWKRPRRHQRPRRNEDIDAIRDSIRQYEDTY